MKLTIFDFDGTIYKHETFKIFMSQLKIHHERLYWAFTLSAAPIYTAYKLNLVPDAIMKQKMIQKFSKALMAMTPDESDRFFQDIYQAIVKDFNQDVLYKLKDYQKAAYETVVLSGAYTPLLEIVATELGINHYIGTNIPEGKGAVDHIHGVRKLNKMKTSFPNINWAESIALSDSYDDLPLLEQVGTPIVVSPDPKLADHAFKHQWYSIS